MHTWRSGGGWDSSIWPTANNPLADITRWHYHEATGLLESKEDAQNKSTQYTYLQGGGLHTRTWARNAASLITTYSYDPNTGELTGIDYSDTTPDIGFSYYRIGQKTAVTDAVGSRGFTYNAALQPETESITGLISRTLTRTYDTGGVIGRNTGVTTDSGYAVTYGHGGTGRFSGVSWNVDSVTDNVTYARVPDSHLLHTTTFASGALVTNSYEPNRNLRIGVKNEYGSATVSQYDYIYDNIGRLESMTTSGDVFSMALPVPPDQNLVNAGTHTSIGYTTNTLNQYSEVDTGGTVITPAHDEDGNLIDDDRFTYGWNGENRLVAVTPSSPISDDRKLEFLYDYMGLRVRRQVSVYDGSVWHPYDTSLYVYDGRNMIEKLDGSDNKQASYVHGLDLSGSLLGAGGIGGLLTRIDHTAATSHIYLYDGNGNVGQLLDSSDGSVAAAYEYTPFGGLISSEGDYADVNPFRFSTKYLDMDMNMYDYGYRFYSLEIGRWLSRDPIAEDGGLNLYAFVGNAPVNMIDLFGLDAVAILWQSNDDANFEAAALSKQKELEDKGDSVFVASYLGTIGVGTDNLYVYSHGNESGPTGYGIGSGEMAINGIPSSPDEYDDFENVRNSIHFMGCNIGRDYDPQTLGNQSFAQFLADYLRAKGKGTTVWAAKTGTHEKLSSPSRRYSTSKLRKLLNGPREKWEAAIRCGDLSVEYTPLNGSYNSF
jgi:RHS repeat-associated protein